MAVRAAALAAALAIMTCGCKTCGPELPVGPQLPLQAGGVTISRLGRKASDAPRAAGRRGDFLIETAGARLVVGAGGASPAARRQHGVLLDLAVDDFGQDLLSGLAPVAVVAGREVALQTRSVRPEAGARAALRVEQSEVGGALQLETFIRAEPQRGVIELVTRATNRGAGVLRDVQLGDRFAWPGATSFAPGLGFVQAHARAHVQWVGRRGEALSYALAFAEPSSVELLFDRVGPTEQVALARGVDLTAGASHEWRRALIVVRGDLTDVAERAWPAGGKPVGMVQGALPTGLDWAVVEARSPDGAPVLGTRGAKDGGWRLALPAGAYRIALISAGGEDVREVLIDPAQPAQRLELLPPRAGTLQVRVRNRADQPVPARLMLRGVYPTRDPLLGDEEHETAAGAGIYVYAPHGDADVALPPGRYRVTATHGPEHTLGEGEAAIAAERGATLRLRVDRAFETPGWIACDFHLHAKPSPDSSVTLEDRIATLVAEGVELAVATDHDHVTDYRPMIEQAGHSEALAATPGVEITTFEWGHFIAFPLEPTTPAPVHDGKTPIELFAEVRALAPQAVLQVNHPRMEHIGYFARIGLDPHTGHMSDERGSLDFDTIEVINGFELHDQAAMDANLQEWLALIELGRRYTAVGNSDSHRLRYQWAGYPRTWVKVPDDTPKNVKPEQIAEALRAQRAIVSNGPFVMASIDGKGPGELVAPVQGHVQLVVDVRTAPWVEVNRVHALIDGQLAGVRRIVGRTGGATAAPLRWRTTLTVPPRDSTVVVVVRGETTLVRAGVPTKPFAFTNPIYVDADGDGEWRRPPTTPDGGVPDGGAGAGGASSVHPTLPSPPSPPAP